MKPTLEEITHAIAVLKAAGYIMNLWHKSDIREASDLGSSLTDQEVDKIAERLEDVSAEDGINWDSIAYFIDEALDEREA